MRPLLTVVVTLLALCTAHASQSRKASILFHPCQSNEVATVGTPSMTSEGTYQIPAKCEPAVCYVLQTGGLFTKRSFSVIRKENQRVSEFESASGDAGYQKGLVGFQKEWRTLMANISTEQDAAEAAARAVHQGQCSLFGGAIDLYPNF